jgi:hypothetical protein
LRLLCFFYYTICEIGCTISNSCKLQYNFQNKITHHTERSDDLVVPWSPCRSRRWSRPCGRAWRACCRAASIRRRRRGTTPRPSCRWARQLGRRPRLWRQVLGAAAEEQIRDQRRALGRPRRVLALHESIIRGEARSVDCKADPGRRWRSLPWRPSGDADADLGRKMARTRIRGGRAYRRARGSRRWNCSTTRWSGGRVRSTTTSATNGARAGAPHACRR